MCCDPPTTALLPPPVGAMLEEYRALHDQRPTEWGGEFDEVGRGQAFARWLGPHLVFSAGDWPSTVRAALPDPLPTGLVVATLEPLGVSLHTGRWPYAIPGSEVEVGVLVDSRLAEPATVTVDGEMVQVAAGGVELVTSTGAGPRRLSIGPASTTAGEQIEPARLRLTAGAPSRWSVLDDRGVAWFPQGALRKWDADGRPMFHGDDIELDVPAVPLTVSCGRGMEFETVIAAITPEAGATVPVTLSPPRLHDPAAGGWYGGDLHVHMNYSGDLVVAPDEAGAMQLGEGLHLMHLVAGNIGTTRVYDRAAFEATVGTDLPWSTDDRVARFGVEFRNDLLGHIHGLGLTGVPSRYSTGHTGSDHPEDWPANAHACAEFRELGATVGYTHPVFSPLSDGTPADAFGFPRSVEARELVADAALGLVDSVDLLGPNDAEGTTLLYHHLLSCGLRLAATVGTDVWLSFSSGPLISNPPGWARVYADLRGAPLSVAAFQEAIRAGRTLATNGPWVELTVDGHGPGDVVEAAAGTTFPVSVTCSGLGVESLQLVGPDGVLAGSDGSPIETTVDVTGSTWLCAVARGPAHPSVPGAPVFAHTSPVHVEVLGRPVSRPASARWLLDWLDLFEALVRDHGRFTEDTQRDDVLDVIRRARPYYLAQLEERG
jgi:hypothetical protein